MEPAPISTVIDTVLLKVASRCNLNCSYCYVYHMGDDGWRNQPKSMPRAVQSEVVRQLGAVYSHQRQPLHIVLHGGEPLMIGAKGLRDLCGRLRSVLPPPCEIHVQTNGLLLTQEVVDILVRFDVGVSISLDGPPDVHDRFRIDHRGVGSYERVRRGIELLAAREDAKPLFTGVLAVIDPASNPHAVYAFLKGTGAPGIDLLVRDGNHSRLPFGKRSARTTEFGRWLATTLDIYLSDPEPPRLRIFDDMIRLILGGKANKEGVGLADYGILVIETDGSINKNDTLKVAHKSADRFQGAAWSILTDNLLDIVHSPDYTEYYRQQQPSARACNSCPELGVCGGGMVAHRWSEERGFDNQTVFCADQLLLIRRMREWIAAHRHRADRMGRAA